jgi:23S rRNA (guanosine2251-2'-O)-methyltransferase
MPVTPNSYLYGKHPIAEALKHLPAAVRHVYFVGGADDNAAIKEQVQKLNIPFDRCNEEHLPRGVDKDAVHQGVVAIVAPGKILRTYKSFIEEVPITNKTAFVLLDELEDPHNVGAVIRSAAALGVSAVLIPEHRQAPVTGTVVKVSAGMAFAVPLVTIGNVNVVLRDLKDRGFWVYGLSEDGKNPLPQEVFDRPSVFVLGNEGRGIREKTLELCDITLRIPLNAKAESLNASASAAVTFYAWNTQRK